MKPAWGRDQPNNYNGEQNCVVLDGGRNWLWNDVGCNLDYLHFICQHGKPNQIEMTFSRRNWNKFFSAVVLQSRCHVDHRIHCKIPPFRGAILRTVRTFPIRVRLAMLSSGMQHAHARAAFGVERRQHANVNWIDRFFFFKYRKLNGFDDYYLPLPLFLKKNRFAFIW